MPNQGESIGRYLCHMAEWVILVEWAAGVTEGSEATVGSAATPGLDFQVSVGTVCRSTEGSASVGLS